MQSGFKYAYVGWELVLSLTSSPQSLSMFKIGINFLKDNKKGESDTYLDANVAMEAEKPVEGTLPEDKKDD